MVVSPVFSTAPLAKVFGIGFHKTGTSSLAAALRLLGYRVTGPDGVHDPEIGVRVSEMTRELSRCFDAFQDNPWPLVYRDMDRMYPGSRFILTLRPTPGWIRSVVDDFGGRSTPMRQWIYGVGCPLGNEATYVARYERHNAEVMEYFFGRADDLLVLRITEGEGWEKLCPFLGHPPVAGPFPHENRARPRA